MHPIKLTKLFLIYVVFQNIGISWMIGQTTQAGFYCEKQCLKYFECAPYYYSIIYFKFQGLDFEDLFDTVQKYRYEFKCALSENYTQYIPSSTLNSKGDGRLLVQKNEQKTLR